MTVDLDGDIVGIVGIVRLPDKVGGAEAMCAVVETPPAHLDAPDAEASEATGVQIDELAVVSSASHNASPRRMKWTGARPSALGLRRRARSSGPR
ncbi:hypothetical protein CQ040_18900 [Microbacterium sp. MYb54]|nr:hypothetical protein CQ032_18095 [Microbacterium sp. MYb43]PQZ73437.1 hypothetical protein CQ031_17360 [Microbacterium sp. MYb40]PRB15663.1 hypothetical protein CQ040_18900 [Microbacterium sp. MYb54]PRB22083.1 hypothetical protein CQ037_18615 [Microbacterium sp. MYb50]PRB60570.1 hypothetical protein CQ021_18920 [Microbacterium sp. MYb24]PRB67951.1 hypothetical protein CQ027_17940 [Microbacterium sp. MYb32]